MKSMHLSGKFMVLFYFSHHRLFFFFPPSVPREEELYSGNKCRIKKVIHQQQKIIA